MMSQELCDGGNDLTGCEVLLLGMLWCIHEQFLKNIYEHINNQGKGWNLFIQTGETYSVSVSALLMQYALFHDYYRINRVKDCWHTSPFAKWWARVTRSLPSSNILVSSLRDHSLGRTWVNTTNRVTEFVNSEIRTMRHNSLNWKNRLFPRESLIRMRHLRIEKSLSDEKSQNLGEKGERMTVFVHPTEEHTLKNCLCSVEREKTVVLPYFDLHKSHENRLHWNANHWLKEGQGLFFTSPIIDFAAAFQFT